MTNELLMTYGPIILAGLVILAILILLLRKRGQHVELGSIDPVIAPTLTRTAPADPVVPADVQLQVPEATGMPDDLRRIKGLGPKVAAQLGALGIVRFDQLAALDADAQAALDTQLGPFAGRMARDRWIDQARLLARDETAAFEAQFGKLG